MRRARDSPDAKWYVPKPSYVRWNVPHDFVTDGRTGVTGPNFTEKVALPDAPPEGVTSSQVVAAAMANAAQVVVEAYRE